MNGAACETCGANVRIDKILEHEGWHTDEYWKWEAVNEFMKHTNESIANLRIALEDACE